jgi:hypothetical protein
LPHKGTKARNFLNCITIAIAYSNRILYFFEHYDENNVIQLKLRFLSKLPKNLLLLALSFDDDNEPFSRDNIADEL